MTSNILSSLVQLREPLENRLRTAKSCNLCATSAQPQREHESGARVAREWLKYIAVICLVFTLGVENAWGATKTFTITHIDATHSSSTQTPITVSIDGTITTSSPQFRFSGAMTVSASGVYKISGISVSTNSTEAYLSPLGAKVSSGTWSKNTATNYVWSGDAKSVIFTPSTTVRITQIVVTYYEVTDTYTVTFEKGSGSCSKTSLDEASPCAGVSLPSATPPSDCVAKGWVFAGWATSSVATATTTAPVLYEAEKTYYPSADETLYAVYKLSEERTSCSAGKINATGDLAVGDCVILYYESGKVQYNGLDGNTYGTKTAYTTTPASTHILEVQEGNSTGQLAFYDKTDKNYLSYSGSSNALQTSEEINANSSWVVTVTSGVATIQNASVTTRYIKYNTNTPRFAGYLSDAGNTSFVNLYKVCPPIVTYNSNPDCTYDYFVDIMHDNETVSKQGSYSAPAALSDATPGDEHCDDKHYHFLGWIEEMYLNEDGTMSDATELKLPGAALTAANKTFYAVWAKVE